VTFEAMWGELAPVGRSAETGGYFRQPFASAETELRHWFVERARDRGLAVESDRWGNLVGWWGDPAGGDAVLTGSHLDSVLDGGAYDGPLGVASSLAAIDLLRERGVNPTKPVGVGVFVEEEGSRFGLACLGSRLAVGAVDEQKALGLRDRDGVSVEDALAATSYPIEASGDLRILDRVGCFVELHVEQGRGLEGLGHAVGVASEIWPHGRYRFTFDGEANHAGTTLMADRHDPMLTYAMTALAANKQARLGGGRATFGRVETTPNSTNSVPSRVTAWLDARTADEAALGELVNQVTRLATERAERDGTTVEVVAESVSTAIGFDPDLAGRIARDHESGDWPVLPTQAGHDAGILSAAGIPTAMLFVRNPTGISHSPAEEASTADCLAGVQALADTLERLSG